MDDVEIATRDRQTLEHLAADGPYVIRHGDVWLRDSLGGAHVADGSGSMAVAFDEDGVLLKHGEASKVSAHASRYDKAMAAALGGDAPAIIVLAFPVTPDTIAELNACAACTGRVLDLEARLARLAPERASPEVPLRSTAPAEPAALARPPADVAPAPSPLKLWVTRDELRGALGMEPLRGDRDVRSEAAMAASLGSLLLAVRQPEYAEGPSDGGVRPRQVPTGRTIEGAAGMVALEASFGPGSKRGLHVDVAAIGDEPRATIALDRAREVSEARSGNPVRARFAGVASGREGSRGL